MIFCFQSDAFKHSSQCCPSLIPSIKHNYCESSTLIANEKSHKFLATFLHSFRQNFYFFQVHIFQGLFWFCFFQVHIFRGSFVRSLIPQEKLSWDSIPFISENDRNTQFLRLLKNLLLMVIRFFNRSTQVTKPWPEFIKNLLKIYSQYNNRSLKLKMCPPSLSFISSSLLIIGDSRTCKAVVFSYISQQLSVSVVRLLK